MLYELRTYTFREGMYPRYLALAEKVGYPIRTSGLARLRGFWEVRGQPLAKVHHLWQYANFEERQEDRARLLRNPDWVQGFLAGALACMLDQHVAFLELLEEAPVPQGDHAYHLRQITTFPGELDALIERDRQHTSTGRALLLRGISPEPNSLYEIVTLPGSMTVSEAAALEPRLTTLGVRPRSVRCEFMQPVSFSPLR